MRRDPEFEASIVAWLAREAHRPAPRSLAAAVSARARTTPQRRARWSIQATGPTRLAAFAGMVAALSVAFVIVGIATGAVFPRQPAAGPPHRTASPTPATTRPSLVIRFEVVDGLYGTFPPIADGSSVGHVPGHGTFLMSGAAIGSGTYTEDVAYTRDGSFSVTRLLSGPAGTLELTAAITLLDSDFKWTGGLNAETHGSWHTIRGTGAWSALDASGTMEGSQGLAAETWSGAIAR